MLIDGEKYACSACIRGHRVSNCQHSDRPLSHIAKKGRPVSQCTHCRTLRKARSAHVKCDCGEKNTNTKEIEKDGCCCSHGGRCNCALKKEHLDPVPESDSDDACSSAPANLPSRPRAHTAQSDGISLTVFANGHHKPAHKHNQMAHKCGLPYTLPRAHSIPSSTSLANRSVESLPHTSSIDALHSESHMKDSMVSAQREQRKVKSEHNSPAIGSTDFDQITSQPPPLDLSGLESLPDGNFGFFEGFPSMPELDQPIFSAGISAPAVDWSHYVGLLDFNDNFATSEFSQAPSFTGFDYNSIDQPGLTTSTSGEISEVEDLGPINEPGVMIQPSQVKQQFGSDYNSDFGDVDGYGVSTASSYMSLPQVQMLASQESSPLDIDDFLKGCTTSDGYVRTDTSAMAGGLSAAHRNESKQYSPTSTTHFKDGNFLLPPLPLDEDCLWMSEYPHSTVPIGREGVEVHEMGVWSQ